MLPIEREFSWNEARQRIEADLTAHGLRWRATAYGEVLHTTVVELSDPDGTPWCTGVGKGNAEAALVGGLFEAFEHYLSLHDACSAEHVLIRARHVSPGLGAPIDALLAAQPDASIACRPFADFFHSETAIYPLALSRPTYLDAVAKDDDFDYSSLRRYASNNGTAMGATFAEAALHAVNEAIERDDVSRFLRVHFHDRDDEELLVVDRAALPRETARLWSEAEGEISDDIVVLDITSHRAARTYLAFAGTSPHPVHVYGSGSSALAVHAIARALTELVQVRRIPAEIPSAAADLAQAERSLRPWARLHRACVADFPACFDTTRRKYVVPPPAIHHGPVAAQLSQSMSLLHAEGYRPLIHRFPRSSRHTALCQVLVPGFDHYHIVANGNLVVPSFPTRRKVHA